MPQTEVIVIGAGISGLAAAHKLTQEGLNVTLIEARDRIGGRIHSTTFNDGSLIELGANYTHMEQGNPLLPIIKRLESQNKLKRTSVPQDLAQLQPILYDGGEDFDIEALGELVEVFNTWAADSIVDEVFQRELKSGQIKSAKQFLDYWFKQEGILPTSETGRKILALVAAFNDDMAVSLDQLSLQDMRNQDGDVVFPELSIGLTGQHFPGEIHPTMEQGEVQDKVVTGGYVKVCDEILDEIKSHPGKLTLLKSHEVSKITETEQGVSVECINKQTGEEVEVQSTEIICTLPLGVLKKFASENRFTPPLPREKQVALQNLEMVDYNKILLRFDAPFWEEDSIYLIYQDDTQHEITAVNKVVLDGEPALICFVHDKLAQYDANTSDLEAAAPILTALKNAYPNYKPPAEVMVSRWHTDEYSLGSWGRYSTSDYMQGYYIALEKPTEHIMFAGEHVTRYGRSVHGAYQSGLDAAGKIFDKRLNEDKQFSWLHSHNAECEELVQLKMIPSIQWLENLSPEKFDKFSKYFDSNYNRLGGLIKENAQREFREGLREVFPDLKQANLTPQRQREIESLKKSTVSSDNLTGVDKRPKKGK